jgi:hypothetical protein
VRAKSLDDPWVRLAIEFETEELAFRQGDHQIMFHAKLEVAKVAMWQLDERDRMVRGQFPGESD